MRSLTLSCKVAQACFASNPCDLSGGLGGRLDHVMSALSTLHKWPHLHLMLWGDGSMAQLLTPGKHLITPAKGFEGPTCGLVPLSGPATITTQGLKWDLGERQLDLLPSRR